MQWNDLVKARLKELDITQEQLSERLGITQGAVGHWLNKRREPSLEQISQILSVLKLDTLALHSDGTLEYPDDSIANVTKLDIQPTHQKSFPVLVLFKQGNGTKPSNLIQLKKLASGTLHQSVAVNGASG